SSSLPTKGHGWVVSSGPSTRSAWRAAANVRRAWSFVRMGGKGVLPQTLADPAGSNRIGVVCQLWTGTPRRCVRTGTWRHAHPSLEHDPHDARTARVVPERLVWAGSARWEGVEMRAWPGVLRSSPRPCSGTSAVALPPLWRVEANAYDQGGGPMTTQTWK